MAKVLGPVTCGRSFESIEKRKKKTVLGGRSRGKSMGSRPPWFSDQVPGEPEL